MHHYTLLFKCRKKYKKKTNKEIQRFLKVCKAKTISISLFDKVTFVRLVIRSLGLLFIPSWIRFSIIKLLNFLSCLIWISASLFDIKRLLESLIRERFIQLVDLSSVDNAFCKSLWSSFIRLCLSLIPFWRFFWHSCFLIRYGLFLTCFNRTNFKEDKTLLKD